MPGRVTTKECIICHHRFPVTEMRKERVSKKSGRSGFSFSIPVSGSASKSRLNTGRNYYRTRDVWICNDCPTPLAMKLGKVWRLLIWAVIIFFVALTFFPDETIPVVKFFLGFFLE